MGAHPSSTAPLGDFSADKRLLLLTPMAALIGIVGALVAYALVWLIGGITNLVYYQRLSAHLISPADNRLGLIAVLIPIIGGLVIGFMAPYGSGEKPGDGVSEGNGGIL